MNYGIELGDINSICFSADYFSTETHSDKSRISFYFEKHKDASCYPFILNEVVEQVSPDVVEDPRYKNESVDY